MMLHAIDWIIFAILFSAVQSQGSLLPVGQCLAQKVDNTQGYITPVGNRVDVDMTWAEASGFRHTFPDGVLGSVQLVLGRPSQIALARVSALHGDVILAYFGQAKRSGIADTAPIWIFTVAAGRMECIKIPADQVRNPLSWFTLQSQF